MTAVLEPTAAVLPAQRADSDPAPRAWHLIERTQAGDMTAWAEVWTRYRPTVHKFIWWRVGNHSLAEDLTSDVFLKALKNVGRVTWQGRDPGAWLITIARNAVLDHYKAGRTRLEIAVNDLSDADREDPDGSAELALDHITNQALHAAVARLNPEQRECIVLRFLRGLSIAETCQAMGKNEGAIKAMTYRAVRALLRDPEVAALRDLP